MIIGQLVSVMTGGVGQKIDENLLIPYCQSNEFKEQLWRKANEPKYVTIDQMLIEMSEMKTNECENANETPMVEMQKQN